MLALLVTVAATAGALGGLWLASFGAGRWGYFVANARFPGAATFICATGLIAGLAAAYGLLRSQVAKPPRTAARGVSVPRLTHGRQSLAGILAVASLWQLLTLDSAADGMLLVATSAVVCSLMAPELVGLLLMAMPTRTLTQRLVVRQISTHRTRMAATAAIYIMLVSVTVGVLTVLYSQVQLIRDQQPVSVPPGQVLVDSYGTPWKKPDPALIAALETVPALSEQRPTTFYLIGDRFLDAETGVEEIRGDVGTIDLPTVSFAFDSVADVEAAAATTLTSEQRTLLTRGGVLVLDPQRVDIDDEGQLDLVVNITGERIGAVPALPLDAPPSRWMDGVPFVMLRDAATRAGFATDPAAVVYVDVSDADAERARAAALDAGFDPSLIGIHEPAPPVVPPAALVGSALGLMLLVLAVALLTSRAQVQGMRPWASRLTHLGVRGSWAKRAISLQYVWIGILSVPVGLLTAVAALGLTRLRLPALSLVVPWGPIALVVAVIFVATSLGALLAVRRLENAPVGEIVI